MYLYHLSALATSDNRPEMQIKAKEDEKCAKCA